MYLTILHFHPFPQVDCSTLSFVRDKMPVFCEKRTEVFNGDHMTTRGYSVDYRYYCYKTRLFLCIYKNFSIPYSISEVNDRLSRQ